MLGGKGQRLCASPQGRLLFRAAGAGLVGVTCRTLKAFQKPAGDNPLEVCARGRGGRHAAQLRIVGRDDADRAASAVRLGTTLQLLPCLTIPVDSHGTNSASTPQTRPHNHVMTPACTPSTLLVHPWVAHRLMHPAQVSG